MGINRDLRKHLKGKVFENSTALDREVNNWIEGKVFTVNTTFISGGGTGQKWTSETWFQFYNTKKKPRCVCVLVIALKKDKTVQFV